MTENLIKIQRKVNRANIAFPILKASDIGPIAATNNDLFFLRQIIIARAIAELPASDLWLRDGKLWNGDLRRYENQIPATIFNRCFQNIECQIEVFETVTVEKRGTLTDKIEKRLKNEICNLEHLIPVIQNRDVLATILSNSLIPEFRFINEPPVPGCHTPPLRWVSEGTANAAREELDRWRAWMQAEAPRQWEFFLSMLRAYRFSRTEINPQRRILVGTGPNASGKGTFCKFLEFMNNCTGMKSFAHDDLCQEWRSSNAFSDDVALAICHEFQLDKPTPSTGVGLVKSASRCEAITVRGVGKEAKTLRFTGGVVLFANAEGGEASSLAQAHRYFAQWLAFDRFSVVFIDWAHRYPGFEVLRQAMNRGGEIADAMGLWFAELAETAREAGDVGFTIPETYREAVAAFSGRSWEAMLEGLLRTWLAFDQWFDACDDPLGKPSLESQRKYATALFIGAFGRNKDLLVSEFVSEKDGRLIPSFRSITIEALLRTFGENRKWQVPEKLKNCIKKSVLVGKSRERFVCFFPSMIDESEL